MTFNRLDYIICSHAEQKEYNFKFTRMFSMLNSTKNTWPVKLAKESLNTYRYESVGNGVAQACEEVGHGKHHEDGMLQKLQHHPQCFLMLK
jgi:hypothetical protein